MRQRLGGEDSRSVGTTLARPGTQPRSRRTASHHAATVQRGITRREPRGSGKAAARGSTLNRSQVNMTGTMQAAIFEKYGRPFHVTTIPRPAPGPGDVLVRIQASGIN